MTTSTYSTRVCWLQSPRLQHNAPNCEIWQEQAVKFNTAVIWRGDLRNDQRKTIVTWPQLPSSSGKHFQRSESWQSRRRADQQKGCWGWRPLQPWTTASSAWTQRRVLQPALLRGPDLPTWEWGRGGPQRYAWLNKYLWLCKCMLENPF